ncbi:MAG TPA: LacI family DNA-binding transcriptional regulator, partial [Gaiellaceae bacterium]
MVTSWDIAREASVSQTTVSRVVNGDRRVARETRQRVEEAIARLGYTPNGVARGLATRRTSLVGVVTGDIRNPFYTQLMAALENRLSEQGLAMVYSSAADRPEHVSTRMLKEQRVDGLIVTSALIDSEAIHTLAEERFPFVLANRYVDGVESDVVTGDNVGGSRVGVEHLIDLGHRRIAVICGDPQASTSRDRFQGFCDGLTRAGIELEWELVRQGDFLYDTAYAEARKLLELRSPPTAIICLNDVMALAALNAAYAAGVSVPRELSVLGFDDIALASWDVFGLTTVRQPLDEMARASVQLLVQRIEQPQAPVQRLSFPSLLVRRRTT